MGGLLNFLSPALTAGTEAASANVEGQREGSALLRAIGLQQAQLAKERAQTDKDAADAFLARRRGTVPMFGDAGYNDAKGAEAGAIEGGKTPALASRAQIMAPITTAQKVDEAKQLSPVTTQTAANTARAEAPVKVDTAVKIAEGEVPARVKVEREKLLSTPLNADENVATAHLPLIASALKTIRTLPDPTVRSTMAGQGGFWRNYLNTPQGQQFNQAATQAALSGAVATEGPRGAQKDRVEYFKKTYVPAAGDDDTTAEQKLTNLNLLMKSVKVKSGRGYDRIAPEERATIDGVLNGTPGASSGGNSSSANPFMSLPKAKP